MKSMCLMIGGTALLCALIFAGLGLLQGFTSSTSTISTMVSMSAEEQWIKDQVFNELNAVGEACLPMAGVLGISGIVLLVIGVFIPGPKEQDKEELDVSD